MCSLCSGKEGVSAACTVKTDTVCTTVWWDQNYAAGWPWLREKYGTGASNLVPDIVNFESSDVVVGILTGPIHETAEAALRIVNSYNFVTWQGRQRNSDIWTNADKMASGGCTISEFSQGTEAATRIGAMPVEALNNYVGGASGVSMVVAQIFDCVDGNIVKSMQDLSDAIVWLSGGVVTGVPVNTHPVNTIYLTDNQNTACPALIQSAIDFAIGSMGVKIYVNHGITSSESTYPNGHFPSNCAGTYTVMPSNNVGELMSSARMYGSFGAPGGNSVRGVVIQPINTSALQENSRADDMVATQVAVALDAIGTSVTRGFKPQMAMRSFSPSQDCSSGRCGDGIMAFFGDLSTFTGILP